MPSPLPYRRALVTGASRGIGEAFARRLAADDVDLVLAARTRTDLDKLADELRAQHGVDVEVVTADLTRDADVAALEARLSDDARPVDLLVNNAGAGSVGPFADADVAHQAQVLELLVTSPTRLAHAAARAMVAARHGGIINVASILSYTPGPQSAVYAASKAFVRSLTEALHEELEGTGVHAVALCPGFTRTAIFDAAEARVPGVPGPLWSEPAEVVETALRDLESPRATSIPGLHNVAFAAAVTRLPGTITRPLGSIVGRRFQA